LNQLSLLANGSTAIKDSAGTTVANLSNGKLDLNKDSIAGTGTITYTDSSGTPGVTLPIGIIIPDSSLSSRFVDVKNKIFNDLKKNIDLFMLNAYYDFKNSTPFTPYIGAGIGLANIKDTKAVQFAYSAIIGAKYNINQNFYFGAKATYTVVNAPTSDIYGVDIKLEDINFLRADVVIGYEF